MLLSEQVSFVGEVTMMPTSWEVSVSDGASCFFAFISWLLPHSTKYKPQMINNAPIML